MGSTGDSKEIKHVRHVAHCVTLNKHFANIYEYFKGVLDPGGLFVASR